MLALCAQVSTIYVVITTLNRPFPQNHHPFSALDFLGAHRNICFV